MSEDKIFYSIAEVSDKTELPKYVIRFWEKEFSEINPDRRQGRRYYRQNDIETILRIKDLLYKKGFTIKGAKKILHEKKSDGAKVFADFQMDEVTQTLEPVQQKSSRILKRFSFDAPLSESEDKKIDFSEAIQKLSEIEKILSE